MKNISYLLLLAILCAFPTKIFSEGVDLPQLVLSADKNNVQPGDTIVFDAKITGWDEAAEGIAVTELILGIKLTDSKSFAEIDNVSPYGWSITFPENYSGDLTYKARAQLGRYFIESNEVPISVKPSTSNIKKLSFDPPEPLIMFPGRVQQLNVVALLSSGKKTSASHSSSQTVYSESIISGLSIVAGDSPVIEVSSNGRVTALQSGEAEVVAKNNGKTASKKIKVIVVKEGDSDGDNLTDVQEESTGTNKYSPDSDKDGSHDDTEVGNDILNPLDLDNNGTIDALDNTTIVIKDASGKFVSIKTSNGTLFTPYSRNIVDYKGFEEEFPEIDMERGVINFDIEGVPINQEVDVTITFEGLDPQRENFMGLNSENNWGSLSNVYREGSQFTLTLFDNESNDLSPVAGDIKFTGGLGKGGDARFKKSSAGGCFIATAAYGSYFEPNVIVLREFRDEYLMSNAVGREIVDFYYKTSPPVANFIQDKESLKLITRIALTPLVYFVKKPGVLFFIILFGVILVFIRTRKKSVREII